MICSDFSGRYQIYIKTGRYLRCKTLTMSIMCYILTSTAYQANTLYSICFLWPSSNDRCLTWVGYARFLNTLSFTFRCPSAADSYFDWDWHICVRVQYVVSIHNRSVLGRMYITKWTSYKNIIIIAYIFLMLQYGFFTCCVFQCILRFDKELWEGI